MRFGVIAVSAGLLAGACATAGYSGSAYISAGRVDLRETTKTVEECAQNVRDATKRPDTASLGQVVQTQRPPPGTGVMGICAGPDGRMYFITATEIQPGPTVKFER